MKYIQYVCCYGCQLSCINTDAIKYNSTFYKADFTKMINMNQDKWESENIKKYSTLSTQHKQKQLVLMLWLIGVNSSTPVNQYHPIS